MDDFRFGKPSHASGGAGIALPFYAFNSFFESVFIDNRLDKIPSVVWLDISYYLPGEAPNIKKSPL